MAPHNPGYKLPVTRNVMLSATPNYDLVIYVLAALTVILKLLNMHTLGQQRE